MPRHLCLEMGVLKPWIVLICQFSVTRFVNLMDFGQLFKAIGNN